MSDLWADAMALETAAEEVCRCYPVNVFEGIVAEAVRVEARAVAKWADRSDAEPEMFPDHYHARLRLAAHVLDLIDPRDEARLVRARLFRMREALEAAEAQR